MGYLIFYTYCDWMQLLYIIVWGDTSGPLKSAENLSRLLQLLESLLRSKA